ncbi:beta-N-acetylhexosaminidase [Algoriphagus sp. CAU 1675]|uniref:beta-N-acetylhexosaminidase n=1 Tax=Algoriphagus sp. CAU 1675 TaxID=3032597 RepID=UPI0023DB9485|nr:beta-N-acetylhexosaminidase [Algoriphagus sp. CAU 1675]MDF2157759.1 beta-N-acetylhexosaminidase [Algoriphagus sp. CAU 1675]
MKRFITPLIGLVILGFQACQEKVSPLTESGLIPVPVTITNSNGVFELVENSSIQVIGEGSGLSFTAQYLAEKLQPSTGYSIPVGSESGNIVLELTGSSSSDESYELEITDNQVKISSPSEAGVFYGVQTLLQAFPAEIFSKTKVDTKWVLPTGTISDKPEYGYRGSMLDVTRHFLSVEDVKHYIDEMATLKLNYLHLHLTDDQGWRIEIKSWPKLTEIGAQTEVGGGEGGFYTQEEYKDIVKYASDRFITVVPEVDMPGHTNAALASYAELNPGVNLPDGDYSTVNEQELDYSMPLKNPQAAELYTGTKVGFSTFSSKLELTYQFIDDVVREITEMTPGPYFHIGGDESHVTEKDDYVYFIERVQGIVEKYGKTSIGWDEVATSNLLPGNVAQFWAMADNAQLAKEQGNQVLMSPSTKAYLDMQYDSLSRIGYNWAAYIELDSAYLWDPATFVEGLGKADIFGVEAPLWTETVTNREDMEYLIFPRIAAIAEVAWAPASSRDWVSFQKRIALMGKKWDVRGIGYYKSPKVNW